MAQSPGQYSRPPQNSPLFEEKNLFVQTLLQECVPIVDADWNDSQNAIYLAIRRIVQNMVGDGAIGDAFKVQELSPTPGTNDFILLGDYLVGLGPDVLFNAGHANKLFENATYHAESPVSPISSDVDECVLTYSSGFWETNELVGRFLVPDITEPGNRYEIVSNTQNTITVISGSLMYTDGARANDQFRIELTTPSGSDREDCVYLDSFLFEIDGATNSLILHSSISPGLEACRRYKLMQNVFVRQGRVLPAGDYTWNGTTTVTAPEDPSAYLFPGNKIKLDSDNQYFPVVSIVGTTVTISNPDSLVIPSGTGPSSKAGALPEQYKNGDGKYIDADGNEHWLLKIASIDRDKGNDFITDSMITDLRPKITRLSDIDDKYVNVTGDYMTGNLEFAPGAMILGDLVVGFNQLKDESVGQRHFKRDEHLLGDLDTVPASGNLPKVHDNRYYRKSEISLLFGENMYVNGDYSKGKDIGWYGNGNLPLYGAPAEQVLEGEALVSWAVCGPQKCCHGVIVQLQPGFSGCEIAVDCQEICVCAGGFYNHTQCFEVFAPSNIPNDIKIIPYVDIIAFSSGKSIGKERYYFDRTIDINGVPTTFDHEFEAQSGLRSIRTLFELPLAVDSIIAVKGFEIEYNKTEEDCARIGERLDIIICNVSLRKFADKGKLEINEFAPPEESTSQVINVSGSAAIASSESRKVPDPICVSDTGLVSYRPGWKQKLLEVYKTDPNVANGSIVWAKNISDHLCPEYVETVCLEGLHSVKTSVGAAAGDIQCFSITPQAPFSSFDIPVSGSNVIDVNFTGINFPTTPGFLTIVEEPDDPNVSIASIVVNPGGTTGSFQMTINDGAVPGVYNLRFTDTSTLEDHICPITLQLEVQPAPCIFDCDRVVFPSTIGVPYDMKIEGRYFVPGSMNVASDDPNLHVSIVGETINTLDLHITPQYPSNTEKTVNLTVISPNGSDVGQIEVCHPTDETRFGFIEGIKNNTLSGEWTSIDQAVVEYESGNLPRLTITGTDLDRITEIKLVLAKCPPRGKSKLTVLATEYQKNTGIDGSIFVIEQPNFLVQHEGAIKVDLSNSIRPDLGYMPVGFRVAEALTSFESRAYTWGCENAVALSAANFTVNSSGTGFNADGLFLKPGTFLRASGTLQGLAAKDLHIPVDSCTDKSVSVQTKIPFDTAQPCNVLTRSSSYGLNTAELTNLGLKLVGPGISTNCTSNSVPTVVEPTAPVITSIVPIQIEQGQTKAFAIHGVGFQSGLSVTISGTDVATLGAVSVNNDGTLITCTLQAQGVAPLGDRDIVVTNPNLLFDTLTNGLEVIFPEAAIALTLDLGDGGPVSGAPSMTFSLDPGTDGQTILRGTPPSLIPSGLDLTAYIANNGKFFFEGKFQNIYNTVVQAWIEDGNGVRGYFPSFNSNIYAAGVWTLIETPLDDIIPSAIDLTDIKHIGFTLTPDAGGVGPTNISIDSIGVQTITPAAQFNIELFGYASTLELNTHWFDVGANHTVSFGNPISRQITPVITWCDNIQNFSFYKDDGWEIADVVLVEGTEELINDPEQEWVTQPEGTTVKQNYSNWSPQSIPERACRNIFVETMYWTYSGCRGVEAEDREYDVEDPMCGCVPPGGYTEVISEMISDPLFYRHLPDDGFMGTPTGLPGNAIEFEFRVHNPITEECEKIIFGTNDSPSHIYYAGGGRNDPNIDTGSAPKHPVTNKPMYVVVHMGPGSPQGSRENLLGSPTTVPAAANSHTFQMSPLGLQGLGVGMDVWIMNYKTPASNGVVCATACDILSDPTDLDSYGLYGTISAIDLGLAQVTVDFDDPTPDAATFQPLWGGRILASPRDRLGYYWEASEGLVDYIGSQPGIVANWNYRLWAAHAADCNNGLFSGIKQCTDIDASVLLADGDGVTAQWKFFGDTGNILKERDWFSLFAAPTREQCLQADGDIGSNVIVVQDASRFSVCDMIEIIDDDFTPGFRTSVQSINLLTDELILKDIIPASLPTKAGFDGFKMARSAKVFRLVTRVNVMISPTEQTEADGTPQVLGQQEKVAVDFVNGIMTFRDSLTACIKICFASATETYQLQSVDGIYVFKGINSANAKSECSKAVHVVSNFDSLIDSTSIARDNSRPPTQNISWGGFQLKDLADAVDNQDAVTLAQLNAALGGIGPETDPNAIYKDGTVPPTADISWGNNKITNLKAATNAADAVRFDQLPIGLSRLETGEYIGNNAGTGGSRLISLADATLTPSGILIYEMAIAPFFGNVAIKIEDGISLLQLSTSFGFKAEADAISSLVLGGFTVGNSAGSASEGANKNGIHYKYIVWGV